MRRELSSVQQELKNGLFKEVLGLLNDYMKTEDYKKQLIAYIADAARFAGGQPLTIYISKSDEDKERISGKKSQE